MQIMFHEVWLSFGISWKANIAAAVHRVMVALLKHAASKIWIAGESWKKYLHGAPAPIGWLPVPSNVSCNPSPEQIAEVRKRYNGTGRRIVGHFGIGDALVEEQLRSFIPALLREPSTLSFLLIGKGSERFAREMQQKHPNLRERIFATGVLPSDDIAAYIGACDLMIQPYVDGISTRRTAAMAVLANGRALLTTSGHSTERFWQDCHQIKIVPASDSVALVAKAMQLLNDDTERSRMAVAGQNLYEDFFTVTASAGVLRGTRQPLTTDFVGHAVLGMKQ
jgi:glycosyltransferase involved in cell wall biosynthesis